MFFYNIYIYTKRTGFKVGGALLMKYLKKFFKKFPVIASVRDLKYLDEAMNSDVVTVFLLTGSIFDLEEAMQKARDNDKLLIINIDMVEGVAKDKKGVEFLAKKNLCDGIISTRSFLIKLAKKTGLITVQRIFMLDSGSFHTAESLIKKSQPDSIEVLPGITALYYFEHEKNMSLPIIAGGLIETNEEVQKLLDQGVIAISTSEKSLWPYS